MADDELPRALCTFAVKKESDEPETDAQDHVGGSNFALCRGGPKIHGSMSTDQRGKKMVLGYASV